MPIANNADFECPRIDVGFRDWKAADITKMYDIYSSNTFCVITLVHLICLTLVMASVIGEFYLPPSDQLLSQCTKEELLKISEHNSDISMNV